MYVMSIPNIPLCVSDFHTHSTMVRKKLYSDSEHPVFLVRNNGSYISVCPVFTLFNKVSTANITSSIQQRYLQHQCQI